MFRTLLAIFLLSIFSLTIDAQTVILDFEAAETSTSFQSFGGSQEGAVNNPVANPNPSGDNTSSMVLPYVKAGDAPTWGGAFSNPAPSRVSSLTSTHFCIKVHMDHIGNVALKFEGGQSGAPDWIQQVSNTKVNEWEEICFDVSLPSLEVPMESAAGNTYTNIVFFVDFGIAGTGSDVTTYLDDFVVKDQEVIVDPPPTGDRVTILDFETEETSTMFQSFGGNQEGVVNGPISNPNPSGINMSESVLIYTKGGDAPNWAGAFSNPNPTRQLDLTNASQICVKVHKGNTGTLALKVENGLDNAPNWIQQMETTKIGEWEEICFDLNLPSLEDPFLPAAGGVYQTVVFFMDFGIDGTGEDVVSYLDDFDVVNQSSGGGETLILDFEEVETTTNFQSFGGNQEGVVSEPVANPNPSGINMSATVMGIVKGGDAPTWGGAFSNPDPTRQIDLTNASQICVKVHKDHVGNLALKVENSLDGAPNWIQTVETTKVNEWEEICFDVSLPSLEDPFLPAAGNVYPRVVFFMDFGTAGTGEDVTNYYDDLVIKSGGGSGGDVVNVTFSLNTNGIADVSSVLVNGTFNDWCGDCNPMADDDGDGIYTATITMAKGAYEYKYTVNGQEEALRKTMECIKATDDFVNRLAVFTEDTELPPVAFESCYNVGDGVNMTFRLGFPEGVAPAEEVYLAGGGNFDTPGGRFQMLDGDDDGIYEITVERLRGFSSYYTFANGNCPGWDCKEDIMGQDCAQPDNFNDRWLPEVNEDVVIATCFGVCSTSANCSEGRVDVSFAVDLNSFEGDVNSVYVSGNFNEYCTDCDALSDNGNGVYTATISVPTGGLEYHYVVNGEAESFPRGSECGASGNDSRNAFVIEDTQMDATCFNSCYACGQGVMLTFRLGIPDDVEVAEEIYLAGGGNFDTPGGRFQLLDDDGDGIYEMSFERAIGFSSYYTFANGNCPDFSCKENIEGQDCARPENFFDRWLEELTEDTVIETCFGICTTDTEACGGVFIERFHVDNNMFQLVPNFTQDISVLSFQAITTDTKIVRVFNSVGRLVMTTELAGNELEYALNTNGWTNGMYYVQVQVGKTLGSHKLMKY